MPLLIKQQTSILQLILAMFNAPPGASNLNYLTVQLNKGQALESLAQSLAESILFFDKQYDTNLSPMDFSEALTKDLFGNRLSDKNKALIIDYMVNKISSGSSQVELIVEFISVLSSVSISDSHWGKAALHYNRHNVTKIIDYLLGDTFTAENKAVVIEFILTQMKAGKTFGAMIVWGIRTLVNVDHDNPVWGNAAKLFNHRVEVAKYHSIDKNAIVTDLVTLQQILSGVTANSATIMIAKAAIDTLQDNACMRIQHMKAFRLDEALKNEKQDSVLSSAQELKFA
ncbi:hypothetical protein [Nitrosomonas ureae]|uniref:Uncharacterized protein n=1 Tax=Nitrosomonas ureae TaxID=44577 RepID=A0A2T5ICM0_9PROT|nr:hypothetical protein [Nitrosomonas ureae]PTQ81575.1 hypothetical protein C8R28_103136 [Nitrosomonas ureae]